MRQRDATILVYALAIATTLVHRIEALGNRTAFTSKGKTPIQQLNYLIAPALFAVVLTSNGCAESISGPKGGDSSSAWTAIDIGEAEIRLEAPGLEEANAKVERREQGWEIQEYSHWQAANSSWPEATLFLRKMKDVAPSNRHFAATRPLPESVQKWFQGEKIEIFTTGTAENRLGEIETLRFRRFEIIDCVLVRQGRSTYSDQISLPSGRAPLGDIVIVGWYCANSREVDTNAAIDGFVSGIGLRGFTDL